MQLISVIIPTWNRAEKIRFAIESVIGQTHHNVEILICDDGSSDNTYEIVRSINDNRIKWIAGAHSGLPAVPRNRGLQQAKGEWIAFLDSDDEWLPGKLENQLNVLDKNNHLACCTNAFNITSENVVGNYLTLEKDLISFDDLLEVNLVICSTVIFHNSLMTTIKNFPENKELRAIEDYAFWLRIASLTDLLYLNTPLIKYCNNPAESIRRYDTGRSLLTQKRIVFRDYLDWARANNIQSEKLEKVTQALNKKENHPISARFIHSLMKLFNV